MLQQMSHMLNSNENFEMDDSFQLSFTHVRRAPNGSGAKRKIKLGHANPETSKRFKSIVITIQNKDNLCCARAIVTAKAKVDNHPNWRGFLRGRTIQNDQAILLHIEANVPQGPCGYDELSKFSLAPSLYDYQLLLVDATRGYSVKSFGPPQDKQLVLLYDNDHYDAITKLQGFFGSSYFCARRLTPYDNEGRHACKNNPDHCRACLQTGCPNYTEAKCCGHQATALCGSCKRLFHGDMCLQNHLSKSYNGKAAVPRMSAYAPSVVNASNVRIVSRTERAKKT